MSTPAPVVTVVGSLNMDLVIRVPRIPRPGETVLGGDMARFRGGKGANQAVAAARLGARTAMIGRVGDDDFGASLRETMLQDGIDVSRLIATPATPSGVGMIFVGPNGQNAIAVASGANSRVTTSDVEAAGDVLRASRVCLLQLEIPLETVVNTLRSCRRLGVMTVLDYAPAPANAPPGLLEADIVSPNEHEAAEMLGLDPHAEHDPLELAKGIRSRGARCVVLKLGSRGALWHDRHETVHLPALPIQPVDTTAAGDAFTAALAVSLANGGKAAASLRFANAAGAAACLTMGAMPSMPDRPRVEQLLNARGR